MSMFQSFLDVFKKNSELSHMFDFDLIEHQTERAYLKKMAIDDVLNFVGRSISQTEFKVYDKGEVNKSDWYYKLNVRPNTDSSASEFWQKVVYRLMYDNEVLIILSDNNDLLIADSFIRTEYAINEDTFTEVTVKGYTFKRVFQMKNVIHLEYNHTKLGKFIDGLFGDLTNIYGRKVDVTLRDNQIRATVNVEGSGTFDTEAIEKLQKYIDRLYKSFSDKSIAIVPQMKGFKYEEVSSNNGSSGSKQSTKEITDLVNEFITVVAKAIGVPPALIHGEMADQSANRDSYIEFCIKPLIKKIEDELNAKLFSSKEFLEGSKINAIGIDRRNIFELANSIDKLISSGAFNRNEIRSETGFEPIENGDEFMITKNYQLESDTLKGGE